MSVPHRDVARQLLPFGHIAVDGGMGGFGAGRVGCAEAAVAPVEARDIAGADIGLRILGLEQRFHLVAPLVGALAAEIAQIVERAQHLGQPHQARLERRFGGRQPGRGQPGQADRHRGQENERPTRHRCFLADDFVGRKAVLRTRFTATAGVSPRRRPSRVLAGAPRRRA